MPGDHVLPLSDEGIQILQQSCSDFSDAVEGKFGCPVHIHNVDFTTASVSGRNKGPDIRYTKQLSGNVKISVWKDDLTTHKVDAVVNAANEHLQHGGGLALALSQAGGSNIQYESAQFVKQYGKVLTGKVAFTTAGKLPCQMVIHAVGPQVSPKPSQREVKAASPYLQEAIWNILTHTDHYNLQSVAIPAISSGLYNFPLDLCADIIVNTVILFSDKRKPAQSLDVRLVNNDDPSVQEMLRACQQFLGPSDTRSGAMQSQSVSSAKSAWPSLELENVTLFLKEGEIQEETTDVIVNPIGSDLRLSLGFVSQAILEKAGKGIQDEVIKRGPMHVTNGTVIETNSHNLKSQAVYHTICDVQQQSKTPILHYVITQCLKKTEAHSFSSISFPAIGTGKLGRSKEEVSQKMIQAVVEFAENYKGKKMEVYFVIYPTDTEKFQAFKKEMAAAKQKSSRISSKAVKNSASYHERDTGTTPCIEFLTDSSEVLREAKEWTLKILHISSGWVTIQNNHIIHFGQKDHENLMSLQAALQVSITEFFRDGKCGIIINGHSTGVSCAALAVEAMLCKAQKQFAQAEENDLLHSVVCWQAFTGSDEPETNAALEKAYLAKNMDFTVNGQNVKIDSRHRIGLFHLYEKLPGLQNSYYQRTSTDKKSYGSSKQIFLESGLKIEKLERIENNALRQVFELNKKRISDRPKQMYQCVKAQYCELISRVGFQRDYAPPEEQKYGAGIYFTDKLKRALELWQDREEQYIYIIEAQVLTGTSSQGSPHMIVPPFKAGTQVHYDSVCNAARDTYVLFNGQQALPEYIYTCIKMR